MGTDEINVGWGETLLDPPRRFMLQKLPAKVNYQYWRATWLISGLEKVLLNIYHCSHVNILSFLFRVVQKNLVFVVGLTQRLADPEVRVTVCRHIIMYSVLYVHVLQHLVFECSHTSISSTDLTIEQLVKRKQYYMYILLNSFHLNCHTLTCRVSSLYLKFRATLNHWLSCKFLFSCSFLRDQSTLASLAKYTR